MESENNVSENEPRLVPLAFAGFFTQPRDSQYCLLEVHQQSDYDCTLELDGQELECAFLPCKLWVPGFTMSAFDHANWFVRWFQQEIHRSFGRTELVLYPLDADLDRVRPRLCLRESCFTRHVYRFEGILPESEPLILPDEGQPPLCLFGLDSPPELYEFNQYRLAAGREVFRIGFDYRLVYTYAVVNGMLMRCVGNDFDSMVYAVIGCYNEDTHGRLEVTVMGMYE